MLTELTKLQRIALAAERKAENKAKRIPAKYIPVIILSPSESAIEGMRQYELCCGIAERVFHLSKMHNIRVFRSRQTFHKYLYRAPYPVILSDWKLTAGLDLQRSYRSIYIGDVYPDRSMIEIIIAANTHYLLQRGHTYQSIQRRYRYYMPTIKELYTNYESLAGPQQAKQHSIIIPQSSSYRPASVPDTIYTFVPPESRKVHGRAPRRKTFMDEGI